MVKKIKGSTSFTPEMLKQAEQEVASLKHSNLVEFVGAVVAVNELWLVIKYPILFIDISKI